MPHVFLAKNYMRIDAAKRAGFTTVSLQGSSRSAKTWSVVQFLCIYCFNNAGTTVSIIRAGMPSIKRTVYRDFKNVMLSLGWWNDKSMNKSEYVYTFPNGSWIEFFSTDNEQKVRGSKRKILFVNEANELSFIEWQQLQMRTTEFSILDYNPSFSEEHWINQVNEEKNTYWFISTYKDNPFLEPKVIAEIESLKWKNPSLWRIYGLGQRAIVEGLVFENVVVDDYIPVEAHRHRYIGMDLGYANDSTAIVEVMLWGNNMYLNELCYKTHMLTDEIIRTLKEIKGHPEIISESADPRLVDEIYNAGLDIKPVKKFAGSINAGIMKMQQYKIHVTSKSTNLRKEFNNYTWRQDKEGKWLNEPIDMWNHCFTGDTLIVTSKGMKCIKDIEEGDNVLTRKGYNRVVKKFNNGIRKVITSKITTNKGVVEISATPEHKFNINGKWKKYVELTEKDILFVVLCLTKKSITDTQTENMPIISIVQKAVETIKKRFYCIMQFGSSLMAKFPKDMLYITKTKIRSTMKSQTYNSLHQVSIKNYILKILRSLTSSIKRMSAMDLHKKIGKEEGLKLSETCKVNHVFVNDAEKNLLLQTYTNVSVLNTAITDGNIQQKKTISNWFASVVGRFLWATNILNRKAVQKNAPTFSHAKVLKIEVKAIREEEVYDLMIENEHEYFANGILVHNCMDATRYVVLEKVLGAYGSGMSASEILGII